VISELLQARLGTGLQLSSLHGAFPQGSSQDIQTFYRSISLLPKHNQVPDGRQQPLRQKPCLSRYREGETVGKQKIL